MATKDEHENRDERGRTALHHAIEDGNTETIQRILKQDDKESLLHAVDNLGQTPLMLALKKGLFDVSKQLLSLDDAGHLILQDFNDETLLHRAVEGRNLDCVKLILEKTACDLDAVGYDINETCLMKALRLDDLSIAETLLKARADPTAPHASPTGLNSIQLAEASRSLKVFKLFLDFAHMPNGGSAEGITDVQRRVAVAEALFKEVDMGILSGREELTACLRLVIDEVPEVVQGQSPELLPYLLKRNRIANARLLLEGGYSVLGRGGGKSSLHLAVESNNVSGAKLYLEFAEKELSKSDLSVWMNAFDCNHQTPLALALAANDSRQMSQLVNLLLKYDQLGPAFLNNLFSIRSNGDLKWTSDLLRRKPSEVAASSDSMDTFLSSLSESPEDVLEILDTFDEDTPIEKQPQTGGFSYVYNMRRLQLLKISWHVFTKDLVRVDTAAKARALFERVKYFPRHSYAQCLLSKLVVQGNEHLKEVFDTEKLNISPFVLHWCLNIDGKLSQDLIGMASKYLSLEWPKSGLNVLSRETLLHVASRLDFQEGLEQLLALDKRRRKPHIMSCLGKAMAAGNKRGTKYYLDEVLPEALNWIGPGGNTFWHYLVTTSRFESRYSCPLLQNYAFDGRGQIKKSLLQLADNGLSPLSTAVLLGRCDLTEKLFSLLESEDLRKSTPCLLWLAVESKDQKMVALVRSRSSPSDWALSAPDGTTAALLCLFDDDDSIFKLLDQDLKEGNVQLPQRGFQELIERRRARKKSLRKDWASPGVVVNQESRLQVTGQVLPRRIMSSRKTKNELSYMHKSAKDSSAQTWPKWDFSYETPFFNDEVEEQITFTDYDYNNYISKPCIQLLRNKRGLLMEFDTIFKYPKLSRKISWPLKCLGDKAEHEGELGQLSCDMLLVLLSAAKEIHIYLKKKSRLAFLDPKLVAIGSTAEGTRIGIHSEADLTLIFNRLNKSHFFILAEDAYQIRVSQEGADFFRAHMPHWIMAKNVFDYTTFIKDVVGELKEVLRSIQLPPDLTTNVDYQPCESCIAVSGSKPYIKHCSKCTPGVCMSKLGPCLIFTWRRSHVLTMDLIPFLYHSAPTSQLFKQMNETLIETTPPDWERNFESYYFRDRITAEEMAREVVAGGERTTRDAMCAMKVQYFEDKPVFMIKPGQALDITKLRGNLKDVYLTCKLFVAIYDNGGFKKPDGQAFGGPNGSCGVKSFFVKKTLMLPEMRELAEKSAYMAWLELMEFHLKPFFSDIWGYFSGQTRMTGLQYYGQLIRAFHAKKSFDFDWMLRKGEVGGEEQAANKHKKAILQMFQ